MYGFMVTAVTDLAWGRGRVPVVDCCEDLAFKKEGRFIEYIRGYWTVQHGVS